MATTFSQAPTQKLSQGDESQTQQLQMNSIEFSEGVVSAANLAVKSRTRVDSTVAPLTVEKHAGENANLHNSVGSQDMLANQNSKTALMTQDDEEFNLKFTAKDLLPKPPLAAKAAVGVNAAKHVTGSQVEAALALDALKTRAPSPNENELISSESILVANTATLSMDGSQKPSGLEESFSQVNNAKSSVKAAEGLEATQPIIKGQNGELIRVSRVFDARSDTTSGTKQPSITASQVAEFDFKNTQPGPDSSSDDEVEPKVVPKNVRKKLNFNKASPTSSSESLQPHRTTVVVTPGIRDAAREMATKLDDDIALKLYNKCFKPMREAGWGYSSTTLGYNYMLPAAPKKVSECVHGENLFKGERELFTYVLQSMPEIVLENFPEFFALPINVTEAPKDGKHFTRRIGTTVPKSSTTSSSLGSKGKRISGGKIETNGGGKVSLEKVVDSKEGKGSTKSSHDSARKSQKDSADPPAAAQSPGYDEAYLESKVTDLDVYNACLKTLLLLGWSYRRGRGNVDYYYMDLDGEEHADNAGLRKAVKAKHPELYRDMVYKWKREKLGLTLKVEVSDNEDEKEADQPKKKSLKKRVVVSQESESSSSSSEEEEEEQIPPMKLETLVKFGVLQKFLVSIGFTWRYGGKSLSGFKVFLPGREGAESVKRHVDYLVSELEIYDYATKNQSILKGLLDEYGRDLSEAPLLPSEYVRPTRDDSPAKTRSRTIRSTSTPSSSATKVAVKKAKQEESDEETKAKKVIKASPKQREQESKSKTVITKVVKQDESSESEVEDDEEDDDEEEETEQKPVVKDESEYNKSKRARVIAKDDAKSQASASKSKKRTSASTNVVVEEDAITDILNDAKNEPKKSRKESVLDLKLTIFADCAFYLTGFEPVPLSEVSTVDEKLYSIKGITEMITKNGGTIFDKPSFSHKKAVSDLSKFKNVFTLSKTGSYRTEKYLMSVAERIPVLHPQFILDSLLAEKLQDYRDYILPKMLLRSPGEPRYVPQVMSRRFEFIPSANWDFDGHLDLTGYTFKVIGPIFWKDLIKRLGGTVVEMNMPKDCFVVAGMEDHSESSMHMITEAREMNFDVYTFDWLLQCFLHASLLDPTANQRFRRRDPVLNLRYPVNQSSPNSREFTPLGRMESDGSIPAFKWGVKRYEMGDFVILRHPLVDVQEISHFRELDPSRVRFGRLRRLFKVSDTNMFRIAVDELYLVPGSSCQLRSAHVLTEYNVDCVFSKIACVAVDRDLGLKQSEKLEAQWNRLCSSEVFWKERLYIMSMHR